MEAVRLLRAGLIRPWSLAEFQGLPGDFAQRVIEATGIMSEVEEGLRKVEEASAANKGRMQRRETLGEPHGSER